ncbi:bifunctional diaminohydroxyphosphoribosylaminopyrimidine deaminase/5-amino-6-(5-phosphoribosylamino)uracil reductase RibD [Priestia megaterium]|uniref:bifunctional diaminohydroxyphosphoribosylaminopyrimidine deaminase/5-amino-6-(5-phosphoribosylamino)uracil reductase RibD n=1 Tax=Priestia TaxID=2800373 RepID=UPI000D51C563|nr:MULTISPECIES: bifunctional diaminohydroxyphosphoribosylaminopyrimidine deaminase/5-amino-6-(5-phosphoribosylamino)uracil reductase RibD [Priestia]MBY0061538.1 bifunctional diaminohydroxyphosphoribosylaminopyrimidine deaminase/5-amino-6-(5-phosphoribosylamino)uracil reductase RibD [Priestia aryabhattai]MDN3362069.1 bifunctional diaminohydroxyphosphoribosylaminopyrimidine deaminase/5-amino-6-(5-phosphoribosylamino)uracil reductase RibD [Priestia megaterium]MED5244158.1 bifunctional diaminohydro
MINHEFYMNIALQNAKATKGQTDPNPLVGSVIVNDNRIVGIGTHLKAGEPHAEIHALRMAGEQAKGATAYVTLEPCSHHGRTGPCAEALVEAGVKKVVIATLDPNPLVAGNGVNILENAGIEVITGVCEEESRQMNEVFNKYIVTKKPFVLLKSAITLDGKIATASSHSKWITSEEARLDVHQLRHETAGILVGVNTVIKDNPELTTRIEGGRSPVRIVMDSKLRMPLDSKLATDSLAPTWVFTSQSHSKEKKEQLEKQGVEVFVTSGEDKVNLEDMLSILGEKFVSSLLIEGGGEVNAAFLENRLIDKLVLYMAPKLSGGKEAPTFLEGKGVEKMWDAVEVERLSITSIGKDFKFVGYPVYK